MSEVEGGGGAALAWRLLATLEGGSLVLATSALLAYTLRKKLATAARARRPRRPVRTVLLTNVTNSLGKELKTRLELRGCIVSTVTSDAESGAESEQVDALVVVGAEASTKPTSLKAIADLVSDDVYHNLEALESLSSRVRRGGRVAWACAGATRGGFRPAADAFDTVIEANLRRVAHSRQCEPVWAGRGANAGHAADRLLQELLNCNSDAYTGFSMRNAAHKVGEYVGRWFKIVT